MLKIIFAFILFFLSCNKPSILIRTAEVKKNTAVKDISFKLKFHNRLEIDKILKKKYFKKKKSKLRRFSIVSNPYVSVFSFIFKANRTNILFAGIDFKSSYISFKNTKKTENLYIPEKFIHDYPNSFYYSKIYQQLFKAFINEKNKKQSMIIYPEFYIMSGEKIEGYIVIPRIPLIIKNVEFSIIVNIYRNIWKKEIIKLQIPAKIILKKIKP